jgi:hypothetical protein
MIRNVLLTFVAVAAFACTSRAQAKPDFSGTWKLNASKSQFSQYGGPNSRTDVITQAGDKFTEKVTSSGDQGDSNYTLAFTADGKDLNVPADSPAANQGQLTLYKISAAWKDSSLVVSESLTYQGQADIPTTLTYTLSQDGKTLTISSHASTPVGDIDSKFILEKQ